ncbi:putative transposase [Bradyrhizobium liaoningense]
MDGRNGPVCHPVRRALCRLSGLTPWGQSADPANPSQRRSYTKLLTLPGVADILIAVVDGLKGFPEAINSVFPKAMVQTCIVHLIRNSLSFVSWKDRKAILPSIKAIYHAENADAALLRLEDFEAEWGKRYPAIGAAWRRAWEHVIPFFAFAPEIRKMIYTTNTVEALNRSLRKIIKTRGSFPNDEAAMKLLYLAIRNAGIHWRRPVAWTAAMGQFAIQFGERFAGSAD